MLCTYGLRITIVLLVLIAVVSPICCNDDSEIVYVPAGDNIELKCPLLSTSTPVIWQNARGLLFDGRQIDTNIELQNKYKVARNNSFGQFNLIIMNVSSADVGVFVCGTYFGNKTIQHSFSVQLAVPIFNLTIQNTNKGFLHGTTLNELSIVCSIYGGIPLRNISMGLEIRNESVMNTFGRSLNFTIIPKYDMHFINVTCRGYDVLLKTVLTETITLNITYPPEVNIKAFPSAVIKEGSSVVLSCIHISNPESKFVNWTKNVIFYQQADNSSKIHFNEVHREDAGTYTCTACNDVGRSSTSIKLIVLYAPIVSVVQLSNGFIFCNATGFPNIHKFSKWEHLSSFGEHIRFIDGSDDGILNIRHEEGSLIYQNNGKYVCTVENGISDTSQQVKQKGYIVLQYQGLPSCLNDSGSIIESEDKIEKRYIQLSVIVISFPSLSNVKWFYGDNIILANSTKYTIASIDTIIQTDILGRLVHINGHRLTLSFAASSHVIYENYSLVIFNNNGRAFCSVNDQWKIQLMEEGLFLTNTFKHIKDGQWYSNNRIGHNTLQGTRKRLYTSIGLTGKCTNRSLRAFAATRLYNAGIEEQHVAETTGTVESLEFIEHSDNCFKKEHLLFGIIPACFLAVLGCVVFLMYCYNRNRMTVNVANPSERQQQQQSQEMSVIINYYDEINDNVLRNHQPENNESTISSFDINDRSENSSSTTNAGPETVESAIVNPYQPLIGNFLYDAHKYSSLTRSHEYFVVIDSSLVHLPERKRYTY